jgi:predicted DCC family thiol-disulfide oxidoreductase YuxK
MAKLPIPADHPTADIIIYDGKCQFCTRQVHRLHRWDGKNRLAFISLHDESVAEHYPDLSQEELMQAMVLIDSKDQRHHGAAAVRVISRRLPRLWILVPLLHIPFSMPLWRAGYQWLAQRRYRLNCDDDNCDIHFR